MKFDNKRIIPNFEKGLYLIEFKKRIKAFIPKLILTPDVYDFIYSHNKYFIFNGNKVEKYCKKLNQECDKYELLYFCDYVISEHKFVPTEYFYYKSPIWSNEKLLEINNKVNKIIEYE